MTHPLLGKAICCDEPDLGDSESWERKWITLRVGWIEGIGSIPLTLHYTTSLDARTSYVDIYLFPSQLARTGKDSHPDTLTAFSAHLMTLPRIPL